MTELVLTTVERVPEELRGYVRDLRVRWALEEAGLAYRIATVSTRDR
jgi:glutathione S-transferase